MRYAECNIVAGVGDAALALQYVNNVRKRAGVYEWTANEMRTANILDERQRELHWELTRRSDLVRHGKYTGGEYMWSYKGSQSDMAGQPVPEYMNVMPIPQQIINAQTDFKQNPGY